MTDPNDTTKYDYLTLTGETRSVDRATFVRLVFHAWERMGLVSDAIEDGLWDLYPRRIPMEALVELRREVGCGV